MIIIYHRNSIPTIEDLFKEIEVNAADYTPVAEIETSDKGHAWDISQNKESEWIRNKEVKPLVLQSSCRSTSVGDVFLVDGQLEIVKAQGYQSIAWGDEVSLFFPSK